MAINQTVNLSSTSIPSGTYGIKAKSKTIGLDVSEFSNEVTFRNDYLKFYFDSAKGTYQVTGIEEDFIDLVTEVIIPATRNGYPVTSIAPGAFAGTFIKKVVIPKSIKEIGYRAFKSCQALTDVTFEQPDYTFYFCNRKRWEDVRCYCYNHNSGEEFNGEAPGNPMTFVKRDGNFDIYSISVPPNCTRVQISGIEDGERVTAPDIETYGENADGHKFRYAGCYELSLKSYSTELEECTFEAPDSDFLFMGGNVFELCPRLTYLSLPHTLKYIPDNAFEKSGISLVAVPLNSSWNGIGAGAFKDTLIEGVFVPPTVKYIGNQAFSGCVRLAHIELKHKRRTSNGYYQLLETIGDGAFEGCESLETIDLPNTVTGIGNYAFHKCYNLKWAVIRGSGFVGDYAFADCSTLEIVIPGNPITFSETTGKPSTIYEWGNLNSIGTYAFMGTALKTFSIPPSLKWIGLSAFKNIPTLTDVVFSTGANAAHTGWFYTSEGAPINGTYITAEDLGVSATACKYLTETYVSYDWYRLEKMPAPELEIDAALLSITDNSGLAQEFIVYVDEQIWCHVDAKSGEITLVNEIETEQE